MKTRLPSVKGLSLILVTGRMLLVEAMPLLMDRSSQKTLWTASLVTRVILPVRRP